MFLRNEQQQKQEGGGQMAGDDEDMEDIEDELLKNFAGMST